MLAIALWSCSFYTYQAAGNTDMQVETPQNLLTFDLLNLNIGFTGVLFLQHLSRFLKSQY